MLPEAGAVVVLGAARELFWEVQGHSLLAHHVPRPCRPWGRHHHNTAEMTLLSPEGHLVAGSAQSGHHEAGSNHREVGTVGHLHDYHHAGSIVGGTETSPHGRQQHGAGVALGHAGEAEIHRCFVLSYHQIHVATQMIHPEVQFFSSSPLQNQLDDFLER